MFEITLKLDEETMHQLRRIFVQQKEIMSALSNLNTNIQGLTLAVAAAIPDLNPAPGTGATEAQVQAAADAVAAQTALLNTAVSGSTTAPAAPTALKAAATAGIVTLSFAASAGATSYNVKRSTTSGSETTVGTTTTGTFTEPSALATGTYFYQVSAVNAAGESASSVEATVSV